VEPGHSLDEISEDDSDGGVIGRRVKAVFLETGVRQRLRVPFILQSRSIFLVEDILIFEERSAGASVSAAMLCMTSVEQSCVP